MNNPSQLGEERYTVITDNNISPHYPTLVVCPSKECIPINNPLLSEVAFVSKPVSASRWNDLQSIDPLDPRSLIALSFINGSEGLQMWSSNFGLAQGAWKPCPFVIVGAPHLAPRKKSNQALVEEAKAWNLEYSQYYKDALAQIFNKIVYLKAGEELINTIQIDLGDGIYTDFQLSFRDNAALLPDSDSPNPLKIPVITYVGSFTGIVKLYLTISKACHTLLALRATDAEGSACIFELECVVGE